MLRMSSQTQMLRARAIVNNLPGARCMSSSKIKSQGSIQIDSFIKTLAECNNNEQVKALLQVNNEEISQRSNVFFWEPLINSVSSTPYKAKQVLEWKLERMLKGPTKNPKDWGEYISLAAKSKNAQLAIRAFTLMEQSQIRMTSSVFNSLILAYGMSNQVTRALSIFEMMQRTENCRPNLDTYNTILSIYSTTGKFKSLDSWYLACKRAGFSPNADTFRHLFMGFMNCDKYDNVDVYFKEMVEYGVMPCLSTLEDLVKGLCKKGFSENVNKIMQLISDGDWPITENVAKHILAFYVRMARIDKMEELLSMVEKHLGSSELLAELHTKIIRAYALSGKLNEVEFSVGRMLQKGLSFSSSKDVESIISSYFQYQEYVRLDLFLKRVQEVYKFPSVTCNMLVKRDEDCGRYEVLQGILNDTEESRVHAGVQ